MDSSYDYEDETFAIRGAIFEVYKTLGTGFLEEVYQNALEEEFAQRNIPFKAKAALNILYKDRICGVYCPDFICYDKIIVELKSVEAIHDSHRAQLLNYLRATGIRLGLLVNFNSYPQIDIRRYVI